MNVFSFNLADEPWVPCVRLSGEPAELGLEQLLLKAHELRGLDHQNPLTEASLYRVILAAVHSIVAGPKNHSEWKHLYLSGKFPEEKIVAYFDKWRSRFDLFSADHPFFQTPGLNVVDGAGGELPVPVHSLMLERSSGNNKTVFDHTRDVVPSSLSPAEAALALVTVQNFSLGGLNKKTTNLFGYQQSYFHSLLVSGLFTILQGENLFETIMLNLLVYEDVEPLPSGKDDCPVWERDDQGGVGPGTPRGYLDFLTCKCRHIRLIPRLEDGRISIAYAHIAQGEAFRAEDNPASFKRLVKQGTKDEAFVPVQLDPDRSLWRDSAALFSFEEGRDYRPRAFKLAGAMHRHKTLPLASKYGCAIYGLANDKANPLLWRKEILSVPAAIFSDSDLVAYLLKALDFSDRAGLALGNSVDEFIRGCLPDNSKDAREKAKATGAMRFFWDRLDGAFRIFLQDIEGKEATLKAWKDTLKRTAADAFETCLRNRYIESVRMMEAWTHASRRLNARLTGLIGKEENQ